MSPADDFLATLDQPSIQKVLFKIELAEYVKDNRIFKKLRGNIWEFRIRSGNRHIRMLAFWHKVLQKPTNVIVTHGFFKKSNRIPSSEIQKAEKLRVDYLKK